MQFDCDMLEPDRVRFHSRPYIRAASGYVDEELMVLLATPGFLPAHFRAFFGWSASRVVRARKLDRSQYLDHGFANAATITIENGLRMVELIHDVDRRAKRTRLAG